MNQDAAMALGIGLLIGVCFGFAILIGILCFFCATLSKALSRCRRRNRTMEPGLVWLNLIPLFNILGWSWYTAIQVGDSLKREFRERDLDDGGDYGKMLGIWTLVSYWVSTLISNTLSFVMMSQRPGPGGIPQASPMATLISMPFSIAFLVLFIVYWVKIAGYGRALAEDDLRGDDDDDDDDVEDDDLDDRPRRPTRPSRPDDRIR
jgi:hypothetical protein